MPDEELLLSLEELQKEITAEADYMYSHLKQLLDQSGGHLSKQQRYGILEYVHGKFTAVGRRLEGICKGQQQPASKPGDSQQRALAYIHDLINGPEATGNRDLQVRLKNTFLDMYEDYYNDTPNEFVPIRATIAAGRIAIETLDRISSEKARKERQHRKNARRQGKR